MKKIKWASAVLSGVMCVSALAGCGFTPINAPTAEEVKDDQHYDGEIALIISEKDDEYLSNLDQAVKAAAHMKGCNLYSVDSDLSMYRELEFVEQAVEDEAGAIIVELVDDTRAQEVIDAAGDTPVVFVNRIPHDTSVLDETHVFVGSDEDQAGLLQGEALADILKMHHKDKAKYLLFQGTEGMVHTKKRSANAVKALEDAGIEAESLTPPMYCNFSRDQSRAKMLTLLKSGLDMEDVDCIIANNDAMALGVIETLEANGIDFTDIPIVGIDGLNEGMRAIREGTMKATVYQDAAAQGSASVQMAMNLALGSDIMTGISYQQAEDNPYIIWIPFETVTSRNVKDFH